MTHNFDFQLDYDEYIENTPLEARFDYLTIELAVIEGFPKHEAYGMLFDEYQRKRTQFSEYDTSEKKRLSFYMQAFPARVTADIALIHNLSIHQFTISIIELGLIHFQVDYHDDYGIIREGRRKLFSMLNDSESRNFYMQLEKQTISLGSGVGKMHGRTKHFVPSVPAWLYNACMDVANYLNMSTSDLVFLCWCLGISNCFHTDNLPSMVFKEASATCAEFEFELKSFSRRIQDILNMMKCERIS